MLQLLLLGKVRLELKLDGNKDIAVVLRFYFKQS